MTEPVEPPREMGGRARILLEQYASIDGETHFLSSTESDCEILAREFTAIRAEAIEECAKVADEHGQSVDNEWNRNLGVTDNMCGMAEDIAADIRALRSLSTKGAGK